MFSSSSRLSSRRPSGPVAGGMVRGDLLVRLYIFVRSLLGCEGEDRRWGAELCFYVYQFFELPSADAGLRSYVSGHLMGYGMGLIVYVARFWVYVVHLCF